MNLSDFYRVAPAARLYKIPQQSLQAAVDRGDVPSEHTGCDLPMVRLEDVRAYKRNPRERGRPRKKRRSQSS